MKALIIKPENKVIEEIEITDQSDIVALVGFETIISDEVNEAGDKLFFDEECFIRGNNGRFKLDNLIPVSGIGIVVGTSGDDLTDKSISIDELKSRVKYL